jgi:hypothetical protein
MLHGVTCFQTILHECEYLVLININLSKIRDVRMGCLKKINDPNSLCLVRNDILC